MKLTETTKSPKTLQLSGFLDDERRGETYPWCPEEDSNLHASRH